MRTLRAQAFFVVLPLLLVFYSCSSGPSVKKQNYAELPQSKFFEYDYETVWRGVETALKNNKILERDPETVAPSEWASLKKRSLETEWVYSQSRDKYHEYKVGGVPKRVALQMRFKQWVSTERRIGGIEVRVRTAEEIETLREDGTPKGYASTEADSSRGSELLERIDQGILSNPSLQRGQ